MDRKVLHFSKLYAKVNFKWVIYLNKTQAKFVNF